MEWISDWLKQIILLVLIATFFDLILPNHSMDRYVKLVMGLLIIMAILSPIFQLLKNDSNLSHLAVALKKGWDGKEMASLPEIREKTETLKRSQDTMIQQQTEKSMEQIMIQHVQTKFGVEVVRAKVKTDWNQQKAPEIMQIEMITRMKLNNKNAFSKMKPIEPVHVEIKESTTPSKVRENKTLEKQIAEYIMQTWQVMPSKVHVQVEQPV
ncbi:stage III sporulation protein AF [Thermoflavimicrobium dichotomicum]|uniref:Stage III sporulation protein AF n=1 Tax=Thermoflavimicrobium dichotomicum TaxID=46223 RepID=A0A1I3QB14_9BACL|nr:stage III sporulation protein AF [Thermoflavimicrobium dichotomicum]SFJ31313.1 stage III sporulation protein AF [Thermoflavimicrobium dichotomicum]